MTHTHTASEPWLKWHFLLSQVWVEGEDVDSKATKCMYTSPIKRKT